MIITTVLLPDAFISSLQETQEDGTVVVHAPAEVEIRVTEGRKLSDSQAYNIRVKDAETMDALLAQFPQATLIGAWSEETGEQVRPFNKALWLEISPDLITTDKEGEVVSVDRPTEVFEFHKWQSSAPRDLT